MALVMAGWSLAHSLLLGKNELFPSSVLRQRYRTQACPHPWPCHEFWGGSFTEEAVCAEGSPTGDRLVACGGTGLPGGIFPIRRDGRFKADGLPLGGS